jgi:hypothetical protein
MCGARRAGCKRISFPDEVEVIEQFLSVWSHFVLGVTFPLAANPISKRLVLLVTPWHNTMAMVSFKLDKLFMLRFPLLVMFRQTKIGSDVAFCSVAFPSEPDFFQNSLSIESNFVLGVSCPLLVAPMPQRLVFLALVWHHAMTIRLLKLDQRFTVLVPELVVSVEVVDGVSFPSEPDFVQKFLSIKPKFAVLMMVPLLVNPLS